MGVQSAKLSATVLKLYLMSYGMGHESDRLLRMGACAEKFTPPTGMVASEVFRNGAQPGAAS
jgi:hypothetical protein